MMCLIGVDSTDNNQSNDIKIDDFWKSVGSMMNGKNSVIDNSWKRFPLKRIFFE